MPYERDDPRAQAPAELLAIGQSDASRPLSAPLPGAPGETAPPVLRVPPRTGEPAPKDFAVDLRPGSAPLVLEPTEDAVAAAAAGRFDGGAPATGFLDGVRPHSEQGSGGGTGERSSEVIYNSDDRTRVPPFSFNWGLTVKIFMSFPDGFSGTCSGTLLNHRFVLTAGHCIVAWEGSHGLASAVTVVPAMDGSYMPYGSYQAATWTTSGHWAAGPDYRFDWGLIRLGSNVGDALGNGALHAANEYDLSTTDYVARGYPGMLAGTPNSSSVPDPRRGSFMWESFDSRGLLVPSHGECAEGGGDHDEYFLCSYADSTAGQSGSGAWLTHLFGREVYAIVSHDALYEPWWAGLEPHNVDMRIRPDNITSMVTWMNSQGPDYPGILAPSAFKVLTPNNAASDPVIVSDTGDNMTAFQLRMDGSLWTRTRTRISATSATWSNDWVSTGGVFTTPISAVSEASGRIVVVGGASDGNLWRGTSVNSGGWAWENLGRPGVGAIAERPALAVYPNFSGHTIVVVDASRDVWLRRSTVVGGVATWGGAWVNVTPGWLKEAVGPPAIAQIDASTTHVVYQTMGTGAAGELATYELRSRVITGSSVAAPTSAYYREGNTPIGFTLVRGGTGRTELLVTESAAASGSLRHKSHTVASGWFNDSDLGGGQLRGSLAAIRRPAIGSGPIHVFGTAVDGTIWRNVLSTGNVWSGWSVQWAGANRFVGSPGLAIGRTNDVLTVLVRRVETSVTLVSRTEEGNGTWLP